MAALLPCPEVELSADAAVCLHRLAGWAVISPSGGNWRAKQWAAGTSGCFPASGTVLCRRCGLSSTLGRCRIATRR